MSDRVFRKHTRVFIYRIQQSSFFKNSESKFREFRILSRPERFTTMKSSSSRTFPFLRSRSFDSISDSTTRNIFLQIICKIIIFVTTVLNLSSLHTPSATQIIFHTPLVCRLFLVDFTGNRLRNSGRCTQRSRKRTVRGMDFKCTTPLSLSLFPGDRWASRRVES